MLRTIGVKNGSISSWQDSEKSEPVTNGQVFFMLKGYIPTFQGNIALNEEQKIG